MEKGTKLGKIKYIGILKRRPGQHTKFKNPILDLGRYTSYVVYTTGDVPFLLNHQVFPSKLVLLVYLAVVASADRQY